MQYVLLFLEGIITFISPCLLPMLPIYISYFAGGNKEDAATRRVLANATGFVIGFTIIFVALGAFAGSIGRLLINYATAINIIAGLLVVLFGLNYLGVFKFRLSPFGGRIRFAAVKRLRFFTAIIFGAVFSISWTPCISAFLGAALLRASQQGSTLEGMFMLFVFSMGLGIPFIVSAMLIGRLKGAFAFIQKHYKIINILSGGLLIIVGIMMMLGVFGRYLSLFA